MFTKTNQSSAEWESLARARFQELSRAEVELLHAAPKGGLALCGPNQTNDDPVNDPSKAEEWGDERQIRADLIRWLCTDRDAKEKVDPRGIRVPEQKSGAHSIYLR
jgi:hypothetical protein